MKYYGKVGFQHTEDFGSGIHKPVLIVKNFRGDVVTYSSRWEKSNDKQNDDLGVNATISIVGDAFAFHNFSEICFCEWMGAKWKVTSVEPQPPRLNLSLGGVYNGEE